MTPPRAIELRLAPPEVRDGAVRLEGRATFPGGRDWRIWFEFTAPDPAQAALNPRPFLLALLPMAMRHGLDIRCAHGIDAVTRRNLATWSETFASWAPDRLRPVALDTPESPCVRAPGAGGSLQPFSGGVDSSHTLLSRPPGARHAGLMVHGFDIPLEDDAAFAVAWSNSAAMLRDHGAEAHRLRTNLRCRGGVRPGPDWEKECHGIWLAAALACLEPWFDEVIIPSTYPIGSLTTPWGSHPRTDPLFASATVPYHHHGADLDKLGKVAGLAGHPSLTERLRVCWQTDHVPANCGRCFKCACTQVCLWLSGVPASAAFPQPCTLATLERLPISRASNRQLVERLASTARDQGRHDLAVALEAALSRPPPAALPRWLAWLGRPSRR